MGYGSARAVGAAREPSAVDELPFRRLTVCAGVNGGEARVEARRPLSRARLAPCPSCAVLASRHARPLRRRLTSSRTVEHICLPPRPDFRACPHSVIKNWLCDFVRPTHSPFSLVRALLSDAAPSPDEGSASETVIAIL